MLRVTPVSSCYAKRGIVQQNLLAALRRPLFVGVFPDAVPVDHYEHGHPLLEQTALVVLQLVRLLPRVHIRVQLLVLNRIWIWIWIWIWNWIWNWIGIRIEIGIGTGIGVIWVLVRMIVLVISLLPFLFQAQTSMRSLLIPLRTPQVVDVRKIEVICAARCAAQRREVFRSRIERRVWERDGGRRVDGRRDGRTEGRTQGSSVQRGIGEEGWPVLAVNGVKNGRVLYGLKLVLRRVLLWSKSRWTMAIPSYSFNLVFNTQWHL